MNPTFFHDYCPRIQVEVEEYGRGSRMVRKYRIHALDADNNVLLGAYSWLSPNEAYDRLCAFVDDELARRKPTDDTHAP